MSYTKEQMRFRLEQAAADMSLFYKQGFVNYRGKTADTGEFYTEVVAQWLLEYSERFDRIVRITRETSYCVQGHDGIPGNPKSNREEELIAMTMKRQGSLPLVGQVLDYQTPLKNAKSDRAGKVDLLAYDGTTLRILELKEPDSKETMLRCVLEGYTYLKTADTDKLLADFGLPANTVVMASPLVFRGGVQWEEMQQDRPCLKQLMEVLGSKAYYVSIEEERYMVTEE